MSEEPLSAALSNVTESKQELLLHYVHMTTEIEGRRLERTHVTSVQRRRCAAFLGRVFPDDVIALAVRWYVRYRLSYTEVSEWLAERSVMVDQSTIYRWVQRYLPLFGDAARRYRQQVGLDWRLDETYARIRGEWALHLSRQRRPRPDC
jgi:hypothetical protein